MKKMVALLSGALLLLTAGIASAYSINYGNALPLPVDGGYSTPYPGMTVEDFEPGGTPIWTWTGSYSIGTGSDSNGAAPSYMNPASIADPTYYIAVPADNATSGSVKATGLGGTFNYLGLWWGSIDGLGGGNNIINTIKFYDGLSEVASVTGDQVIASDPNGSWTAAGTNRYVNFLDLPSFDSFELMSQGKAFEADNIAVGNVPVPEPGTMVLLGAGLLGLGIFNRRRMKK